MLLAAYATGIFMVHFIASWEITGPGIAIGSLLLLWASLCRSRWAWLPLLGLLFIAGLLHASLELKPAPDANHISRLANAAPLLLEGRLLTVEKRQTGGYRLYVEMRQATNKQGSLGVSGR